MRETYWADVIVVGGGTAGSFFAWRMAQCDHKVLVCEKQKLKQLGTGIEIIHMEKIRLEEFNIPFPNEPELIHTEDINFTYSPDMKIKVPIRGVFFVMNMPLFMQRLHNYAREAGATFLDGAEINEVIIDKGSLVGVRGIRNGEDFDARARLIVDASGLKAAVRTRLPENFYAENQPVPTEKCLYVCLELRSHIPEGFPTGSNGYMYHKAFWNRSYNDDVVLGIGQPLSFDYAWQKHKEWAETYFGNPGVVIGKRQGVIPFTRSPLSLVGNGFMAIGDAANQNKPFSGEGVTSGFTAAAIAVNVADNTLKKGNVTLETLWEYNHRYQTGQGAKFAASLAQLPATVELSRQDVNYLFHKGIIFTSEDFEALNKNYEITFSIIKLVKIALTLIWGVLCRKFSFRSLMTFLKASSQAGRIKAHYQNYPSDPAMFEMWAAKAKELWHEA